MKLTIIPTNLVINLLLSLFSSFVEKENKNQIFSNITPYASSSNLDALINKLEESTNNLFQWFRNNHMKANADKCHLLVTGNYEVSANINEFEIESSKKEKLLGILLDARLSFEYHITSLCKKKTVKSCMRLQE